MDTYGAFAPSESEVASYKEKLDNSKAEQKNLFLIIFQVSLLVEITFKVKFRSKHILYESFRQNLSFRFV